MGIANRAAVPYVSVNGVRGCVLAAASAGLSVEQSSAMIGIDRETLADPGARVSVELLYRAWNVVAERVGDDAFGLHVAEIMQDSLFDVYDFAVTHAPTLRDALQSMIRNLRLQHDGAELHLSVARREARIEVNFYTTRELPRHFCECAVAVWYLRARSLLTAPFVARRIDFRHREPNDLSEHRRIFAAPVTFGARTDGVCFDAALLDTPLVTANLALHRVMEEHAADRATRLPAQASIEDRVRQVIERHLARGVPSLPAIARSLGMSARSLQRALADVGSSHSTLLDSVRRELALSWLADRTRSIQEISDALGFANPTAFARAFRRWTGGPPSSQRPGSPSSA